MKCYLKKLIEKKVKRKMSLNLSVSVEKLNMDNKKEDKNANKSKEKVNYIICFSFFYRFLIYFIYKSEMEM